jgi:hypothetical protein
VANERRPEVVEGAIDDIESVTFLLCVIGRAPG